MRLELTTYRLTAGRAADCAIQEHVVRRLMASSLLTLVVEHSLCKRKVGDSIPPVGSVFLFEFFLSHTKHTTSQRFELWRAEPNRFLIYLLNHSDTMSQLITYSVQVASCCIEHSSQANCRRRSKLEFAIFFSCCVQQQ